MNKSINTALTNLCLAGCIHYSINIYLSNVYLQRETLEFISFFTSNFIFCRDSTVLGQVNDHGLILFRLKGCIVLKSTFCTFGLLGELTLMFSLRSNLAAVPLNTLIFFGRPHGDFYNHFV